MNGLATSALLGAGSGGHADVPGPETPADVLVDDATSGTGERERRLLLRAGAGWVYRAARRTLETPPESAPAGPESRAPICSVGAESLLRTLLSAHRALLPEALARLEAAELAPPPTLLPQLLDLGEPALREATRPVLGDRGRWLAAQRRAWDWALRPAPGVGVTPPLPPDAERRWAEGTAAARVALLQQARRVDRVLADRWLRGTWESEPARTRAALLGTWEADLQPSDELLLVEASDDRARTVRAVACRLLATLPGSALAARMRARAAALVVERGPGRVALAAPAELPASWRADGLVAKPPAALGERSWWALQVVELVPPDHWCERFLMDPCELLARVEGDDQALVEAWTRAALRFGSRPWMRPLHAHWRGTAAAISGRERVISKHLDRVVARMPPPPEAEILRLLSAGAAIEGRAYAETLGQLPVPWSERLGLAWLTATRRHVATRAHRDRARGFFRDALQPAAHALPAACFQPALRPWTFPAGQRGASLRRWAFGLDAFCDTIRLRQRLHTEIPIP